jgi:pimeloyl-ACP methyl ester carboxylesterase
VALLGLVAFLWVVAAPGQAAAATAAGAGKVVELPVSFQVKNTNTSGVACPSDGAEYTIRGHITGPQAVLAGAAPRAIAVYLTGEETSEWNWRFTAVPGYNWPGELARLGYVSLTVDMLGYGASGHPDGNEVCWGSQADVTHQIIGDLRHGAYRVDRGVPVDFARVALVGHDVGGAVAQIEAYSYKDIEGLAVITYADQGFTPLIMERFARAGAFCAGGGEPAYPGGPSGYYYIERPEEFEADLFYNADPAVVAASLRLRERNPCGYEASALVGINTDLARLSEIHVPVLLAIGAQDKIWTQDGWAQQQGHFTGSDDVTAQSLADTGHFVMLELTVPKFRSLVTGWLARHGFGGA